MHLGGIGTGNFEIGSDGQFTTWQLFNTLRDGYVPLCFGVKAGKRWEKWGVFAKARPGFTSFSQGRFILDLDSAGNFVSSHFERTTHFTTDVGGVLEFYPTLRIVTRFDAGDTIIHYGPQSVRNFFPPPTTFTLPAATRHNFQFNAGIGFRFD